MPRERYNSQVGLQPIMCENIQLRKYIKQVSFLKIPSQQQRCHQKYVHSGDIVSHKVSSGTDENRAFANEDVHVSSHVSSVCKVLLSSVERN